jgi:hypothetical protein
MSRDDAFIKSSLENNPRWSAPEVVVEGRYSKVRAAPPAVGPGMCVGGDLVGVPCTTT